MVWIIRYKTHAIDEPRAVEVAARDVFDAARLSHRAILRDGEDPVEVCWLEINPDDEMSRQFLIETKHAA